MPSGTIKLVAKGDEEIQIKNKSKTFICEINLKFSNCKTYFLEFEDFHKSFMGIDGYFEKYENGEIEAKYIIVQTDDKNFKVAVENSASTYI